MNPSPTAVAGVAGSGLYRNLWRFAAGARLTLAAAVALLIASQLLRLTLPWLAGHAIDALQAGGADAAWHAGGWALAMLVMSIAAWSMHGPGRILEREVGVRVRRSFTDALFDKLAAAPLKWHDRHAPSDLQQRMSQSSGALDDFAQNQYRRPAGPRDVRRHARRARHVRADDRHRRGRRRTACWSSSGCASTAR